LIKIGIDSSTTNTAVVALDGDKIIFAKLYSPKSKDILERSGEIVKHISRWFNKENLLFKNQEILVGIESASFQSKGMRDKLTMLLGAIFYNIKLEGFSIKLIPPSSIKKSFTGNGRATKYEMEESTPKEALEHFQGISKKTDDLIDAYAIACML
jgi:Holliday junction resolvasome RuvABC endonuclease subunit